MHGGHAHVYGVNNADNIYVRPVDGSGSWRQIPGRLRHVTASGKSEVFGTNAHGYVYRCKKPCIRELEKVEGNLKQCDATFNSIVGVTTSSAIYRRHMHGNMRTCPYLYIFTVHVATCQSHNNYRISHYCT